jgi:hypothetical protein
MPMRPTMLIVMVIASSELAGCARWQQIEKPEIGRPGGIHRGMQPPQERTELPLSRKEVVGKHGPAMLLAADGTECAVTEKRYREVSVGEFVWCGWRRN